MTVALGATLVVVGVALSLLVAARLQRSLRPALSTAIQVPCGFVVAAGALLVQDAADPGSWVIAMGLLGAFAPLHARFVFGPPGTPR